MQRYSVCAAVHGGIGGIGGRGGSGEGERCWLQWDGCAPGTRHVLFANERNEEELGPGDEKLGNGSDASGLYDVVKADVWRRLTLETTKANVWARLENGAEWRASLEKTVGAWTYEESDESELAMQDEVREYLIKAIFALEVDRNVRNELVECLVKAVPTGRGGAPVFTVEAAGPDCWAVTSYWPAPMRHTAFAGVPVEVQSEGGLRYDVFVKTEAVPRLQQIV